MLDRHLIAKTRPRANRENVVFWQDYRVTVLGARLFRLEQSKQKRFRDGATQAVWFRDMQRAEFTFTDGDEAAVIDTGVCRLILHKDRGRVCVEINGAPVLANNEGNLLGTYRTLDNCNADVYFRHWIPDEPPKKIALGTGVCSTTGVAVLDDSTSLTLAENGEIQNETADGTDEYIFAFGDDYRGAVQALYQITGATPIVPRYALGNWWSRYHVYTDEEYLRVINRFAERDVPLTVATVDMDWHYSDNIDKELGITASGKGGKAYVGGSGYPLGWTGYTWNKNLFPDYKSFLRALQKTGVKITLNLHPSDGVRWWERDYAKMAKALGASDLDGKQIPFDFSNAEFINAYFAVLHRPYEEDGVDFWWIDWQQKNIPWSAEKKGGAREDYDPLWALNHYHYLDNARRGAPLVLSRYAGVGSHRYPLGFSGDTEITWDTLGYLPYFTATATNVGYTWWSHDIGGHNFGEKSDELYVRHIQYGVFSPINRLHCACDETMTKEPWEYGNGAGLIAAEFLRLRHRMIPYLYTASVNVHERGLALIEPLYYRHGERAAYAYRQTYYFGGELLVAPVTERAKKDGYARVRTWLPEGRWTDIFTGDVYEVGKGGKKTTLYRTLDGIPVLAKAGGVLPLSADRGNGCGNPQRLEIRIYNGNNEYTLIEDGLESGNSGEFKTSFINRYVEKAGTCIQTTEIYADGDGGLVPKNRSVRLRYENVEKGELRLWRNGKKATPKRVRTDCACIEIPIKAGARYRVEVRFAAKSAVEKVRARALKVITRTEWKNTAKYNAWKAIEKAATVAEYLAAVDGSELPAITKKILKETL